MLLIHYYNIEIYLYEVALSDNHNFIDYGTFPFTRLDMLFACLNSTRAFFDSWNSVPLSAYSASPYTIWTQVGHALVALSKLTLFVGRGWDQNYVRSIIDFAKTIDKFKADVEEVRKLTTQHQDEQMIPEYFPGLGEKLQLMKDFNERRLRAQSTHQGPTPDTSSVEGVSLPEIPDDIFAPGTTLFQFMNDQFWQEFT